MGGECGLVGGKYLESVHEGRAFARQTRMSADISRISADTLRGRPAGYAGPGFFLFSLHLRYLSLVRSSLSGQACRIFSDSSVSLLRGGNAR